MKVRLHFDYWLMMCISVAFSVVYLGCLLWAGLLVLMQVFGWLRFGEWQSLPLHAIFMTENAQAGLRVFGTGVQPLGIVPAWGLAETGPDLAWQMSGKRMVGVAKVLTWLLDTSLVFWAVVVAVLSLAFAVGAKADSTALVDTSASEPRPGPL